jgi:UDP:flavonoid glycosyltransferase YjiC (YdhE family)
MRFLPKNNPLWGEGEMCGESEYETYRIPRIQEKLYKIIYFGLKTIFINKNRILRLFAQAFPESGKRFFASKMSNSDPPHVFYKKNSIFRAKIRFFAKIFSRG